MLLSICIPTWNRAEYLRNTLESIVTQDCWPVEDVEIVISDNKSTDATPQVIAEYIARYPENIRGESLPEAIDAHENFDLVLSRGYGKYVKLNNDTLAWNPGMLKEFIQMLRETQAELFLTPASPMCPGRDRKTFRLSGMDDAVKYCSYFLTWIGNLCIRKDIFMNLDDRNRKIASRLTQLDLILRLLSAGSSAVMDGRIFFHTQNIVKKIDYQIAEVFGCNYFSLLGEYLGKGISSSVFESEKKRMLFDFLIPGYFDFFNEKGGIRQSGYWKYTAVYHRDWYFYVSFVRISVLWLISRFFSHEVLRNLKHKAAGMIHFRRRTEKC